MYFIKFHHFKSSQGGTTAGRLFVAAPTTQARAGLHGRCARLLGQQDRRSVTRAAFDRQQSIQQFDPNTQLARRWGKINWRLQCSESFSVETPVRHRRAVDCQSGRP